MYLASHLGAVASAEELEEIARDAYIYAYPMVLMDTTRLQMTNYEEAPGTPPGVGPANAFHHVREFPDPRFRIVIRPNADTLYSSAWVDLGEEPVVLSVPAVERYFLLPMLSMWTDVFAVPGTRTTGAAQPRSFLIAGPGWSGAVPPDLDLIRSPTRHVWFIGRTQVLGKADCEAVRAVQDGYRLTPRSRYGRPGLSVPRGSVDPSIDMKTPPPVQVDAMDLAEFFACFADALADNPPNPCDYPMLHRLERIGLAPGCPFDLEAMPGAVRTAFERGALRGKSVLVNEARVLSGSTGGGWSWRPDGGAYGVDYLRRAATARFGLGTNLPQDAVYPSLATDAEGRPLDGSHAYVLHLDRGEEPPVDAFWSLTAYDADGFFIPNALGRHSLGDRDRLTRNADGSLDLFVQARSPGRELLRNWLPVAPGPFNLLLRLYSPRPEVAEGRWAPPALRRVG